MLFVVVVVVVKINLFERQSYEREKESLPSAGSFLRWPQSPDWARPKPGTFFWVSDMGAVALTLGPSTHAFPDTLAGSFIRSKAARTQSGKGRQATQVTV